MYLKYSQMVLFCLLKFIILNYKMRYINRITNIMMKIYK